MALEIRLLGAPRVSRDGQPVVFETRKAMALLAHLALADRPRSRAALCELLYPAYETDRARGALRRTLSTLRKGIGDEWIDTTGDSIALRRGPGLMLDVGRFRALAGDDASEERLDEAIALFSGDFLEGFSLRDSPEFESWQLSEAGALERELASALSRRVEQLVARGDVERAIAYARRWLALDQLHEPAHRQLIRLYAWSGDRAAALEQYRTCVRTLSRELGVAPLEETSTLFAQINDGSLLVPEHVQSGRVAPPRAAGADAPPELPLVGRAQQLQALVCAHAAAQPDGHLAVLEGEAGIGKTRLAQELARRARDRGAVVLAARCHEDEANLPYGPVIELLREAMRVAEGRDWPKRLPARRLADASLLLPELAGLRDDVPAALPLDGPAAQVQLLEAVACVLCAACRADAPGLVVVDDVHGADEATLDAIAYLGHRLTDRPLLLALTWRSEALPPGHRLRRLAVDRARAGAATIVSPKRLDGDEVAQLVRAAREGARDSDLERRVYIESEGLPLFVAEYLTTLHASGTDVEQTLPPQVRGLLDARLAPIGEAARQVLGAAAVIGRSFDLDTLRRSSGRSDEETVDALEELVACGVIRELPGTDPVYDFSHEKLRAFVYEQTGLARRRLLHRRVAAVLAGPRPDVARAAVVAAHLGQAGDQARAAEQHLLAAEHAASLHAHADALGHLEAALALGYPDAASVHERMGDLRTLRGDYGGALTSYRTATAYCDRAALPAIEHKIGNVHQRRGEWALAEARFLEALDAAPADERALRARIEADLSLTLHRAGHGQR
ncbi:MAG: AAA family ATPase, partial [Actinomycetota bacterium]|nr:AAA family ATPase [Actinomycetota bacterium]